MTLRPFLQDASNSLCYQTQSATLLVRESIHSSYVEIEPEALAKWYSQPKPTRAKLQNPKLASVSGQTIPPSQASLQETIQFSESDRVVT